MRHATRAFLWVAALVVALPVAPRHPAVAQPHADQPTAAQAGRLADLRVAFTQRFNVYLMDGNGGHRGVVTTRGTGYSGIYYPWYAWSPDGTYLLLVRATFRQSAASTYDLLLLNRDGVVLRTLATGPSDTDFFPSWALDADQIAYVASTSFVQAQVPHVHNTVDRVDIFGNKTFLWSYDSLEGCGGGTSDPADRLYWDETGFGDNAPTLQWSVSRHVAVYTRSCIGGLNLTDLRSGSTRVLGRPLAPLGEAALSPSGTLAAVVGSARNSAAQIVLTGLQPGATLRTIAYGTLPAWSRDGRFLYFEQRITGQILHMRDELGNQVDAQTYTTTLWRANADGSHAVRLGLQDAFGFGPLNPTPGGQALIFSRVDNVWNLWRHRRADNSITPALLQRYGPTVSVQRFDLVGRVVTLATDAGRPAIQP